MYKKYILISTLPFILFAISICSCEKMVSVQPPINQITNSSIFSSDQSATSVVLGMYVKMVGSTNYDYLLTVLPSLTSDELNNYSSNISFISYATNNIPVNEGYADIIWSYSYNIIYQANAFLDNISASQAVSTPAKNQLSGEALFMRSFMYYTLTNFFGSVPLVTTSNVEVTASAPRAPEDSIYRQIINDLTNATGLLGNGYITSDRSRINKYAAMSLLARVYLYCHQYDSAIYYSSTVISSGMYSLNTTLSNVFQKSSPETIFQYYTSNGYTDLGTNFIPTGQLPNFAFTTDFLNNISTGDKRVASWMGTTLNSGITYYYPYKYKNRSTNTTNPEYLVLLRLAEQYLIRAEAMADENNLSGSASDLNVVRNRAGLSSISPSTSSALLTAISNERRIELFSEWGHRWFDLKRNGLINSVMIAIKPSSWSATDSLYPIPITEISSNPNLIQNPGY